MGVMINLALKGSAYMFEGEKVTVVNEPKIFLRYRIERTGEIKADTTVFFLKYADECNQEQP